NDGSLAAPLRLLILREDGYAGAPMKDPMAWYDADLSKHFGAIADDKDIIEAVRNHLQNAPFRVVDKAKTIRSVFEDDPALRELLVIYINSASLRCRVNGLTDNMFVGRKNGEFGLLMRNEHKEFGGLAPKEFKDVFFANYSGAEGALFARGQAQPVARALAVDQSQTLERAKPNFPKLTKMLLADKTLGPKLTASV